MRHERHSFSSYAAHQITTANAIIPVPLLEAAPGIRAVAVFEKRLYNDRLVCSRDHD
jgi:hypothetical protein